jgi:hypothetical protein
MTIQEKLATIQRELHAPKGQTNKFGGYQYRSCEDILQAVKPLLGDCALTITDELVFSGMLEDEIIGAGDKAMKVQTQRVYIKAVVTLSDGKDSITTSAMAREASIKKGMDASQVSGAASSYARKYALNGLFAIDDNKDADTDQHRRTVDAGHDMSLEGLASSPVEEPKKRIDKALMQKSLSALVTAYDTEDDAGLYEIWAELAEHEKEFVWHQLNGKQKTQIRSVTPKKEAA